MPRRQWLATYRSGILDHPLSRMMTVSSRRALAPLLPSPAARPEPLVQMNRRWCCHAYRVLVFRNRDYDLAGMQMQSRLAKARTIAINIVADNRPAHFRAMNPQFMRTPRTPFQPEP